MFPLPSFLGKEHQACFFFSVANWRMIIHQYFLLKQAGLLTVVTFLVMLWYPSVTVAWFISV